MILLSSHRSSVIKPSQPMGAARREPRRGEIPVEQVRSLPSDDFPFSGASRTNVRIADRQFTVLPVGKQIEFFIRNR
jgi:hypothetical protein